MHKSVVIIYRSLRVRRLLRGGATLLGGIRIYVYDSITWLFFLKKNTIFILVAVGKMCSLNMFFWTHSGRQNPHFRREGGFHRSQAQRRARKNNIFIWEMFIFFNLYFTARVDPEPAPPDKVPEVFRHWTQQVHQPVQDWRVDTIFSIKNNEILKDFFLRLICQHQRGDLLFG